MSKYVPLACLAAGVAAFVAGGCLEESTKDKEAFAAQSFASFADRWERYQSGKLIANARLLAQVYEQRLKHPGYIFRDGKKIKLDPMFDTTRAPLFRGPATPAINMFASHISGSRGALIGEIDGEGARLRIWVEDARVYAVWHLFGFKKDGSLADVPRFSDTVGDRPAGLTRNSDNFQSTVSSAWRTRRESSGNTNGWTFATRFLKYSDQSCLSCHKGKKLGDIAGVMVYAARPEK